MELESVKLENPFAVVRSPTRSVKDWKPSFLSRSLTASERSMIRENVEKRERAARIIQNAYLKWRTFTQRKKQDTLRASVAGIVHNMDERTPVSIKFAPTQWRQGLSGRGLRREPSMSPQSIRRYWKANVQIQGPKQEEAVEDAPQRWPIILLSVVGVLLICGGMMYLNRKPISETSEEVHHHHHHHRYSHSQHNLDELAKLAEAAVSAASSDNAARPIGELHHDPRAKEGTSKNGTLTPGNLHTLLTQIRDSESRRDDGSIN